MWQKTKRKNIQQNKKIPLIWRWCGSFGTCSETYSRYSSRYDNCSITDWLEHKHIKKKSNINRNKNVNEPERIKVNWQIKKCSNFYTFRLLGNKHKAEKAEIKKGALSLVINVTMH